MSCGWRRKGFKGDGQKDTTGCWRQLFVMSVVSLPLAIIGDGDTATRAGDGIKPVPETLNSFTSSSRFRCGGRAFSPRHSSHSSHIWSLSWEKGGRWQACSAKSSKGTKTKLVEETSEIWRAYHQHQQQKRDLFALWNGWERGCGDGNGDFGNRHHSRATP